MWVLKKAEFNDMSEYKIVNEYSLVFKHLNETFLWIMSIINNSNSNNNDNNKNYSWCDALDNLFLY